MLFIDVGINVSASVIKWIPQCKLNKAQV